MASKKKNKKGADPVAVTTVDAPDGINPEDLHDEHTLKEGIATWTRRARGVGLLLGFAVAFLMSRRAGLPWTDAALRGVVGAFAMSLVLWWCTLMVIQGLIRTALMRRNEAREKAYAEIIAAQEAAAAAAASTTEPDDPFAPRADL